MGETVKFGHVTFFWNGNRSGCFNPEMEEYVEIPSDSGISFNIQPKMKALEIVEKARDAILSKKFEQVRVNLPNGDMVRHTGDIEATIVACKAADQAVKVPIAIGGHGLAPGFRFRKDLPSGGLANVAATMINLHGFEAPSQENIGKRILTLLFPKF
ncbi:2,3-bisphosphoglycerate-independent phosphoglycerate mutase isoform X1 [Rosa chinensis]|nr:2,3-bisphosphoglycerate-independent phosphoglycerate mutase isoform X1 [Rosa chinensis]